MLCFYKMLNHLFVTCYGIQIINNAVKYIDKGCSKAGVFGNECNSSCPTNCKDNLCHIEFGTCFACSPGWTGKSCDKSKKNYLLLLNLIQFLY